MKIYIVGSGGVGGYFGGLLAKAGNNVTLLARNEHYEALKKNGLIIKSVTGAFCVSGVPPETNPIGIEHGYVSGRIPDTPNFIFGNKTNFNWIFFI